PANPRLPNGELVVVHVDRRCRVLSHHAAVAPGRQIRGGRGVGVSVGLGKLDPDEVVRALGIKVVALFRADDVVRRAQELAAPLRDPAIDVVHVTTANDLHPPLVREALRVGKHVVCEKPLASDLEGAEKLAEWSKLSGRQTTICQNYRFLPLVAELASRVAAG